MLENREMTSRLIVAALRDAGCDLDAIDDVPAALAMSDALKDVPARAPSKLDALQADVSAGKVTPKQLAKRVHETALVEIKQARYSHVRTVVAESIAARTLAALHRGAGEVHAQLKAMFDAHAATLMEAMSELDGITDAGAALDAGKEQAWRDAKQAGQALEPIAHGVQQLPALGLGTSGDHRTWYVQVDHLDAVAALPHEKPDDPLGRFAAWARAGYTLELATGAGKVAGDTHMQEIKRGEAGAFQRAQRNKMTPAARADSDAFTRGAPVIHKV